MTTYTISTDKKIPYCGHSGCEAPAKYRLEGIASSPYLRCEKHLGFLVNWHKDELIISLVPNHETTYSIKGHPHNREVLSGIRGQENAESIRKTLADGDQTVDTAGPVWCEKHAKTLWPHGDCPGPGMWVNNSELAFYGMRPIARPKG